MSSVVRDNCRDVIAFLHDYLEGSLSSEQRAVFEGHLGHCPYCRDYLQTYRDTIALARGVADPALDPDLAEPPSELVDAIARSLLAAREPADDHSC